MAAGRDQAAAVSMLCEISASRGGFRLHAAFEAEPGEVVAVVGPNGSGKTTLLRVLAGLTRLQHGRIVVNGVSFADTATGLDLPPHRRAIAMVAQQPRLFPHLRVIDNVAFGPRALGSPKREARRHAREVLAALGADDLSTRHPASLSGGEAQRVAMARALAVAPDLLLLDEPASGLDLRGRQALRAAVLKRARADRAVTTMVTHDAGEAAGADRVVVLEAGEMVQSDFPDRVRSHPRSAFAAQLMGVNALDGTIERDAFASGPLRLSVAGAAREAGAPGRDGPARVLIRPSSIGVHGERPGGSPRNVLDGTVHDIESTPGRVRLTVHCPAPLLADITYDALSELGLAVGSHVWLSIKATDITVGPLPD